MLIIRYYGILDQYLLSVNHSIPQQTHMKQLKVYKLRYVVGSYIKAYNRNNKNRYEDRLEGELICKAYSLVHAVKQLRNIVGHPYFEVKNAWIEDGTTWRSVDESC